MKKKVILIAGIFYSLCFYSQVGINTQTPQSTLDVTGEPGNAGKLDGIIAPRLTGVQLRAKNYTAAQKGALVFVTAADTSPALQTVNVTSSGYFFFDGTLWIKLNTGGYDSTDDAFVNNSANSRVELGSNADGTTARSAGTDFVIQNNGHVGVGTSTPATALQVVENSSAGSNEIRMSAANNPPQVVVDRNKASNLSSGDEIGRFVFNGKISGSSFPVAGITAFYNGTGTTNSSSMVFRTSDSQKMIIDATGNVGIGIGAASATAMLDVNGSARIRGLADVTSNASFSRNIVSDTNGNLGYSGITVPGNVNGIAAINDGPATVCTNCFLTQVVPVLIVLQALSRLSPPSYNFNQSGNNITIDFQSSTNDATTVAYSIIFVKKQ